MHCFEKDVISFSPGGIFVTRRTKRFAQMMTFVVIVAFVTVVVYQNVHGLKEINVDTYQQLSYADTASIKSAAVNQNPAAHNSLTTAATDNARTINENHIDSGAGNIVTNYLLKRQHITYETSVTGTPKPATTTLDDIFITVKTTKLYHNTRLALIIKTWFKLAKQQVSIF